MNNEVVLMTVAEAESKGYTLKHPNAGGPIIRMGKWDGDCLQFIDVKADPIPEKAGA